MFDLEHDGRRSIGVTRDEAINLGYPLEVVNAAAMAALAVVVGLECKRRIYAIATAETQMNMASYASMISAKDKAARTAADAAFLAGFTAALSWVQAMRDAASAIVASPPDDVLDGGGWPDVPPEVLAVAAQF